MSEKTGKGNKLTIGKLTSVDLVKRGANPDADICLFKSANGEEPTAPAAEPDNLSPEDISLAKRLFSFIKSTFMPITENEPTAEPVAKDARSFSAVSAEREVNENLWRYSDALMTSFRSVVEDTTLDATQRQTMLLESLEQFTEAMKGFIPAFAGIAKTAGEEPPETPETEPETIDKGDDEMNFANIDTSALNEQEKATLAILAKKCNIEGAPEAPAEPTAPVVEKSADPALLAVIEELKKSNAALLEKEEKREMLGVAKKYEVLGKNADELADTLLNLKKSGEANYNVVIGMLDEQVTHLEKSGLFTEIGKSGSNPVTFGDADEAAQQIETLAKSISAEKGISVAEARIEAYEQNPQLADLCASAF